MSNINNQTTSHDTTETTVAAPLPGIIESDDWDLPVCGLRQGDEGFETCESCQ